MNNSQSLIKSKLFNLKKWLTIEESAKYLSIMFDEDVSEADVLRLGLDKHLKLSVNFVNYAYALVGEKFLEFDQWKELSLESRGSALLTAIMRFKDVQSFKA